ncbi:class I SAM-dependent methyltransferase [Candidatus Gracilibacteria bacterium]|nr:class I SAM-dependent methyltransferase [Candidatus Gracilibacteria bacterium]
MGVGVFFALMSEYDQFAKDFSRTRQGDWPEFDLIFPHLHKGDRILDLGCGNGRLRKFLSSDIIPQGQYFGLDISEELLRFARTEFPKDHFFRGDFAKKLPFGTDNFNMVISIAAFHHLLSQADQLSFLGECHRILRSGGILFLTTWKLPRKYFWSNFLAGRWKNWIIPFGVEKHFRTYRKVSDSELRKLLKKSKFKVISADLFRNKNYVAIAKKK